MNDVSEKKNPLLIQAEKLMEKLNKRLEKEEALCEFYANNEVENLRWAIWKLGEAIQGIELL